MRQDKERALSLRLSGYSYNQIVQELGIPKSTLSDWFTNLVLSEKAQQRIRERVREASLRGLIKKNKLQTHEARQRAAEIQKTAKKEIKRLSKQAILLLGTTIYWAEGYKKLIVRNNVERTSHAISLSNSDPIMVKLFIHFLKEILKIPERKIYASVRMYEHINENDALRYWQDVTKLPKENFRKFYYGVSKSSQGKRPYNRLPFGTIQISVGDTKNFHRIMGWIKGIKKFFR